MSVFSSSKFIIRICFRGIFRLSGLSPFAGSDDQDTLNNVRKCDWNFDSDGFKGISDIGKDFIRKLLIKTPQYELLIT